MIEIKRENLLFILKNEIEMLDEKTLEMVTEITFPQVICNINKEGTYLISGDKETLEHIQDNNTNFWLN
jgi:hypothetical protein